MAFVYKAVRAEDEDYQKYIRLEQRYMEETPKEILEKHNYLYNYEGDSFYRKKSSIGIRGVSVVFDDEREIYLLLIHPEDSRPDYSTPMAWVLFVGIEMILMNCECEDDMGSLESGKKWYKNRYLVETLVLGDSMQNKEEEIKQYIADALTVFSESGRKLSFESISTEVLFDQTYCFKGYNN